MDIREHFTNTYNYYNSILECFLTDYDRLVEENSNLIKKNSELLEEIKSIKLFLDNQLDSAIYYNEEKEL